MRMSGRLEGKISVITGAGQGIGRAAAVAFSAEGAAVWAIDRNPAPLMSLADEHPEITTGVLDVADPAGVATLASRIGPIDVLFNCAGVVHSGNALQLLRFRHRRPAGVHDLAVMAQLKSHRHAA